MKKKKTPSLAKSKKKRTAAGARGQRALPGKKTNKKTSKKKVSPKKKSSVKVSRKKTSKKRAVGQQKKATSKKPSLLGRGKKRAVISQKSFSLPSSVSKDIFGIYKITPRQIALPKKENSASKVLGNQPQAGLLSQELKNWEQSPFLLDLREKNTAEIKKIIKKEKKLFFRSHQSFSFIKKPKERKGPRINLAKAPRWLLWEEKLRQWEIVENFWRKISSWRSRRSWRRFEEEEQWREEGIYFSYQKAWGGFVIFVLLLVLPFWAALLYKKASQKKGLILGQSIKAVDSLEKGKEFLGQADFEKANNYFLLSWQSFEDTENNFSALSSWWGEILGQLPLLSKVKSGELLVKTGKNLSKAAYYLSSSLKELKKGNCLSTESSLKVNGEKLKTINFDPSYFTYLKLAKEKSALARAEINKAEENLEKVDSSAFPADIQEKVENLQKTLPIFSQAVGSLNDFLVLAEGFLAENDLRRYLVVFQNNYELRASGGFIGSFALVDIVNGQVKSIEMPEGGSYDLQGGLTKRISPPLPLYLVTSYWQFHDANWWPDFPASAQKLMEFYEASGGPSVDGVVALSPEIIKELLKITGPIEMPEYGETVDAENFMWVTEYKVEVEYDRQENRPKKFLVDLAGRLLEKIHKKFQEDSVGTAKKFLIALENSLAKKDIQFYLRDENLESLLRKYSWGGRLKNFDGDYLMVVDTNIGGGKTDGVVNTTIELRTEFDSQGRAIDTLIIKKRHNGNPQDYFQKARNVDWLRVYVPQGAELLSAQGFSKIDPSYFKVPQQGLETDPDLAKREGVFTIDPSSGTYIYNEFGKTVFANWATVDVGKETEIVLRYRLPFSKSFSRFNTYSLLVQKQSGANHYFYHTLILPPSFYEIWNNLEEINFKGRLDRDMVIGRIFALKQ